MQPNTPRYTPLTQWMRHVFALQLMGLFNIWYSARRSYPYAYDAFYTRMDDFPYPQIELLTHLRESKLTLFCFLFLLLLPLLLRCIPFFARGFAAAKIVPSVSYSWEAVGVSIIGGLTISHFFTQSISLFFTQLQLCFFLFAEGAPSLLVFVGIYYTVRWDKIGSPTYYAYLGWFLICATCFPPL